MNTIPTADASWRLNRVAAIEANLLTIHASSSPAPLIGAVRMAASIADAKALANLSMHSQRRTDMDTLLDTMELYQSKGEIYHPSHDGFVFRESQIAQAQRRRTHAQSRRQTLKAAA